MTREINSANDSDLKWQKSSHSASLVHCVETADAPSGGVAVRDSKNIGRSWSFPGISGSPSSTASSSVSSTASPPEPGS
jgi:hypothetical protein